ncbi:MAG TPA: hypothetical protein VFA10_15480 [Ktedonobacteraceae bacterium]|nr:hypothetical protein [Ktedonobacteraceae bacterium]
MFEERKKREIDEKENACLATTHWAYTDRLQAYGARPQPYRPTGWVTDGKFTTAAGVSGAVDMAIGLGAKLTNQEKAQFGQLMIEYDPQPPFGGIDYQHMKLFPRLLRGIFSLMAPYYTGKARRLTRQEGRATTVHEGKEQRSDLVGV